MLTMMNGCAARRATARVQHFVEGEAGGRGRFGFELANCEYRGEKCTYHLARRRQETPFPGLVLQQAQRGG